MRNQKVVLLHNISPSLIFLSCILNKIAYVGFEWILKVVTMILSQNFHAFYMKSLGEIGIIEETNTSLTLGCKNIIQKSLVAHIEVFLLSLHKLLMKEERCFTN